jgi:hypothetical protein
VGSAPEPGGLVLRVGLLVLLTQALALGLCGLALGHEPAAPLAPATGAAHQRREQAVSVDGAAVFVAGELVGLAITVFTAS